MSLRRRLFLATAGAVVLSVGISLLIGGVLTRRAVRQANIQNLGRQAALLSDRAQAIGPGFLSARPFRRVRRTPGTRLVVAPLRAERGSLPQPAIAALRAGSPSQGQTEVGGRKLIYAAQPLAGQDVLVLLRPAGVRAADWSPFLDSFLLAGAVGAALAAVISLALARAIGGPVVRVAGAARTLAAGRTPTPLPLEGPRELASLSASFNHMQDELAAAREHERSFLLSVSHELNTPLTAIRGYVEAMRDDAVPADEGASVIGREAERLDRLVRDLLDLARIDQRSFDVRREPVDLVEVARDSVHRYERLADEFGVTLVASTSVTALVSADGGRVLQVVSNLVENALRATPRGGTVTVTARPGTIAVADSGSGLAPEDLPRAFERFYLHRKLGGTNGVGSGLGLAIVKELTAAMGGRVSVNSGPSGGATFSVELQGGSPGHDPAAGAGATEPGAVG